MPTPTERIISHLPRIYRNLGRDSILHTLLDVFGGDLAKATNVLTRVLRSHWVDHADREVLEPEDLRHMAALFGLAPHPHETAESFRHHLKHSIQVLLGSTVTVQGILRVAAEVLDLSIADAYSELDSWWKRPTPELITLSPATDDDEAAELLFGVKGAEVHGTGPRPVAMDQGVSALPAVLTGTVDLSAGLDLREPLGRYLRLAIDGPWLVEVDLTSQVTDSEALEAVSLDQLVAAINGALGGAAGLDSPLASHDGRFLTLTSPTTGPEGRIELLPPAAQDATNRLLGAGPPVATGSPSRAAQLVGSRDLSAGVDLRSGSRLWLRIDGPEPDDAEAAFQLVPIDAGKEAADRASVRPFEVVTAINTTLTKKLGAAYAQFARQDGRVVTLVSPHPGPQSFLSLESPVGEDGEPEPGNATDAIFGFLPCRSRGSGASVLPAGLTGTADLSAGLDLSEPLGRYLRLAVDGTRLVEVDLASQLQDPQALNAVSLDQLVGAINGALGGPAGLDSPVASHDGRFLTLTSPTTGPEGRLELFPPAAQDATQRVLGDAPRVATGSPPRASQLVGSRDLSAGVDLRSGSTLWLGIDGPEPGGSESASQLIPIDAGREAADRASVRHFEVVTAINTTLTEMFGEAYAQVARQDGRVVSLASPHPGPQSYLSLESPVADNGEPEPGNATEAIFGFPPCRSGKTPATAALLLAPVTLTGRENLADGLTLAGPSFLVLGMDDSPLRVIRLDPQGGASASGAANGTFRILLEEIAEKINNAFHADFGGAQVAATDGRVLTLASPSTSLASAIWFAAPSVLHGESLPQEARDYLTLVERLFGVQLSSFSDPIVDLTERHRLAVAVDQGSPLTIHLTKDEAEPSKSWACLGEIRDAINQGWIEAGGEATIACLVPGEDAVPAIPGEVPEPHGVETPLTWTPLCVTRRLALCSPTAGKESSIRVVPLRREERRRYVTRAMVTHEAAHSILGFVRREASGEPATAVCVRGSLDLRRGIDLRSARHLRLRVDEGEFQDVDCGANSKRLHAATLTEVIASINEKFPYIEAIGTGVARDKDHHLEIRSGTTGLQSRIAFETPRPEDALPDLLGLPPGTHRGTPAAGIVFTGVADLSAGAALPPEAAIRIAIHPDQESVAITFPARDTPYPAQELAATINAALGQPVAAVVADAFGVHLQLIPPGQGSGCLLELAPPAGVDVTEQLFGVPAGRTYRGSEGTPAVVTGLVLLPAGADLSTKRHLRLSLNGQPAVVIDCAGTADDPTSTQPSQIVEAINQTPGAPLASLGVVDDEQVLVLTSPEAGGGSEISLEPIHAPDARALLFGEVPQEATGAPATPARLVGEVDLLRPVDLSERKVLRLVLSEGGDPLDIDVAGADPARTDLSEIITAINAAVPGLASATPDDRLLLTAPPAAEGESYLAVWPLRYLELIEFPLQPQSASSPDLGHGHGFAVVNPSLPSAPPASASIEVQALQPIVGPALVNHQGDQVRLFTTVQRGEAVHLQADAVQGLRAEIVPPSGGNREVPPHRILVGPIGTQVWLPCILPWRVHPDSPLSARLQLNNPAAPHLVLLRARRYSATVYDIQVVITPSGSGSTADAPPHFNVRLQAVIDGKELEDFYPNVSIGDPDLAPGSLVYEMLAGVAPSRLALAESMDKGDVLRLSQGRSTWRFLEHATSRFDQDHADQPNARYVSIPCGGLLPADPGTDFCEHRGTYDLSRLDNAFFTPADPLDSCYREQGVFGVSRFAAVAGEPVVPVFASAQPSPFRLAQLTVNWDYHQPGAFVLNLPAELSSRFTEPEKTPLHLEAKGAVLQPEDDDTFLEKVWRSQQGPVPGPRLLRTRLVSRVPLGWRAVPVPFRSPHRLSLGNPRQAARLYLQEPGSERFLELEAPEPGAWGNDIGVTVRRSREGGPAHYDVSILYPAILPLAFKTAVMGDDNEVTTSTRITRFGYDQPIIAPAAVMDAKAAGIRASITRNSVDPLF